MLHLTPSEISAGIIDDISPTTVEIHKRLPTRWQPVIETARALVESLQASPLKWLGGAALVGATGVAAGGYRALHH